MSKKVIITGGLGYLGTVLAPWLRERGYDCTVYDAGFFKDCLAYPYDDQGVVFKDARDISEKDLEGASAVVHFAGISNDPVGNLSPGMVYDPTRQYARQIAIHCKNLGVRFVFASSCSIYGIASEAIVSEDSKPNPQTGYSLNKLQVEEDLAEIAGPGFHPIALRFATAFGMSARVRLELYIPMMVAMALVKKEIVLNSDGQAWRPNVHVEDICEAVTRAIEHEGQRGKLLILNVGENDQNHKVIDVAHTIAAQIKGTKVNFLSQSKAAAEELELFRDRKLKNAGADTRSYRVNFDRVHQIFQGFKCKWTVDAGIDQLAKAMREIKFSDRDLKNINYYRLQKMEFLWKSGIIGDDFRMSRLLS